MAKKVLKRYFGVYLAGDDYPEAIFSYESDAKKWLVAKFCNNIDYHWLDKEIKPLMLDSEILAR